MTSRSDVLADLLAAGQAAAELVMRVYASGDLDAQLKGPNDPVTRADKEANALLLERLGRVLPGVPIVAEESDPSTFVGARTSDTALFVDPVDGTRELIERTGEFCVMIGFAENGAATVGVVVCPVLGRAYAGAVGEGAFVLAEDGSRSPIQVSAASRLDEARVAVSRFHRSKSIDAKLAALGARELVPMGSAGIKGARVASGEIDLFAHPSRGAMKLWDACAPDAIVRAAGGLLTDATGRPFDYRGEVGTQGTGTLAASPALHAEALRLFASVVER